MKWGETGRDKSKSGLEEIVLTLYLGPFVCRDLFSASRSLTVCFTRTPWYTLLEYSRQSRGTLCESTFEHKPKNSCVVIQNFHPSPQMCVHLTAQFYSYRRTTLWDRCVNVMEIAFGFRRCKWTAKKRQFTRNIHREGRLISANVVKKKILRVIIMRKLLKIMN